MKIDPFKVFYAPDDDDGGAAAVDADLEPVESSDEPEPEAEEPEVAPAGFDPKVLAQALGAELGKHLAKPTPVEPEKPRLTAEEAKKLMNVWEPSTEWLAKYDNLETRKSAIEEQRDALIRQADTITQVRLQEIEERLEKRYAPAVRYAQQAEAENRQKRFASVYPQLAAPELTPVLSTITQQLEAEGRRFGSEAEVFEAVAKRAESTIKVVQKDFKLVKGKSMPSSSIPVTTPGGGGGGGSTKGAAPRNVPRAVQFMPKIGG